MNKTILKWVFLIAFSVRVGMGLGFIWYAKILQTPIPPPTELLPVVMTVTGCDDLGNQINADYNLGQTKKWKDATLVRGLEIDLPNETCTLTTPINLDFSHPTILKGGILKSATTIFKVNGPGPTSFNGMSFQGTSPTISTTTPILNITQDHFKNVIAPSEAGWKIMGTDKTQQQVCDQNGLCQLSPYCGAGYTGGEPCPPPLTPNPNGAYCKSSWANAAPNLAHCPSPENTLQKGSESYEYQLPIWNCPYGIANSLGECPAISGDPTEFGLPTTMTTEFYSAGKVVATTSAMIPLEDERNGAIFQSFIVVGAVAPIGTDLIGDDIDLASTSAGPTALDWERDFIADSHLEWIGHMEWNYNSDGQVCQSHNDITGTSTEITSCF